MVTVLGDIVRWSCASCGQTNADRAKFCVGCGAVKPTPAPFGGWTCGSCREPNPESTTSCTACGAAKPAGGLTHAGCEGPTEGSEIDLICDAMETGERADPSVPSNQRYATEEGTEQARLGDVEVDIAKDSLIDSLNQLIIQSDMPNDQTNALQEKPLRQEPVILQTEAPLASGFMQGKFSCACEPCEPASGDRVLVSAPVPSALPRSQVTRRQAVQPAPQPAWQLR